MIVAQEKKGYGVLPDELSRPAPRRRPRRVPSGQKFALICLVVAGFLLAALVIFYYAQVAALGYQISRMEEDLARLRVEKDSLDAEVQKLASLDRIELVAVNKLGMVKPDGQNVLLVTIDSPKTVTTTASSGQAADVAEKKPGSARNQLIQAFTDLVNRLESRARPGQRPGDVFLEGLHADDYQYIDSQKDYRTISAGCNSLCFVDFSPGLAAAC